MSDSAFSNIISNVKEIVENIVSFIPPVHPAGWPFIGIFAFVTLIIGYISSVLFWIGVVLTIWCVLFFRDPERFTPQGKGQIISPADGIVIKVEDKADFPPQFESLSGQKAKKISIFMNVFNVHVNRTPIDGKVKDVNYVPGKFFNASLDKASEDNERSLTLLDTEYGDVAFVQIAGLVARRIINQLEVGDEVKAGDRMGIIRFGSRVDVYLPTTAQVNIKEGQTMIAGETIIAKLKKSSK